MRDALQDEFEELIRSRGFSIATLRRSENLNTFQDDNATDEVVGVFFKRGTPEVDLFLTGILCPKRSAASLTRSALVSFAGWHLPILLQPQTTTSLRYFAMAIGSPRPSLQMSFWLFDNRAAVMSTRSKFILLKEPVPGMPLGSRQ